MWRTASAFVVFQTVWFAAVIYGPQGNPWLALVLTAVLGWLLHGHERGLPHWRLILGFTMLGTALDLIWLNTGILSYPARGSVSGWQWPPVWIAILWLGVGLTLTNLLAWSVRTPQLAVLAGALGSLSYLGAIRLEAVAMPSIPLGMGALAVSWSGLFVLTCYALRQSSAFASSFAAAASAAANRSPEDAS